MHLSKPLAIGILLILALGFSENGSGQPFKLGKISAHDFITGEYTKDPDASAVILYDYGSTSVELDSRGRRGFFYIYRRQMRLQVLDERGLEWGNHSILLAGSNYLRETMGNFSGFVHQLENGEVKTVEVKSRSGLIEHLVEGLRSVNYSFPDVKPGAIIEVGYTIRSNYLYNLRPWQFQYAIPVEYSEYNLNVPDFFNYQFFVQGFEPFATFDTRKVSAGALGHMTSGTKHHWVMKDVPAMRDEPYTNSISNYRSGIRFELASMFLPGQPFTPLIRHWDDVDKHLNEDEGINKFLSGTRQLNKQLKALNQDSCSESEKIMLAMNYVQTHVRWNQQSAIWVSKSLQKVMSQGEGNSAEVNLMLIAALRQLGLQAHPVISSTRSNGILTPGFPTLSGFNYLVAHVRLEDGTGVLLDATDHHCPPGMLPVRALNGKGRLMDQGKGQWIDLKPQHAASQEKKYHFSLDVQGNLTATATLISKEYAAYTLRKELEKHSGVDKYKDTLQTKTPGMLISQLQIENQEDIHQPLIQRMEFEMQKAVSHTGGMMFFKPLLMESLNENPFRLEERKFPVDFTYPQKEEIVMVYDLPQGYEIEFLPQSMRISFKNKLVFDFSTKVNDRNQLEIKKIIENPFYVVETSDYPALKEFFNKIVEKQNEQIVLKKVS